MVTYDYYRIFYYAALFKSFSKAAEVLTSNQPNIARTITRLESELSCKLFIPLPSRGHTDARRRSPLQACSHCL